MPQLINLEKLYELAKENALPLGRELFDLNSFLARHYQIKNFLADSNVPLAQKKEFFTRLCPQAGSLFKAFIQLLFEQDLFSKLPWFTGKFLAILLEKRNIRFAKLISALPLSEETVSRIKQCYGDNLYFIQEVDPQLSGGFIIETADHNLLNASVSGRLKQLRTEMVQ
ncbi:ATP synthase F1 subunit delta [candidate division WOR-1 bacterium RIFCSPLOWO2_02_FULL_46_20]|uniref:ATP synthase subunit delta n=1 Tax=candidate division WOR-1 bacterium RIFCSPLOWO2_02_FULL_46_20 TaxID=1802567 RepID=A0A1F4RCG1_UNCSA|nr:MAG: ATP synthase F1 subunit delta [candidate division WOR-1 bacterium RIFCSPLOWO2_02_FULL_46_20]